MPQVVPVLSGQHLLLHLLLLHLPLLLLLLHLPLLLLLVHLKTILQSMSTPVLASLLLSCWSTPGSSSLEILSPSTHVSTSTRLGGAAAANAAIRPSTPAYSVAPSAHASQGLWEDYVLVVSEVVSEGVQVPGLLPHVHLGQDATHRPRYPPDRSSAPQTASETPLGSASRWRGPAR